MSRQDLDAFKAAYERQFRFNDENLVMLNWYADRIVRSIRAKPALRFLSLGIGHQVVLNSIAKGLGPNLASYTIVEGSAELIKVVRSQNVLNNVELVHSFFEDYRPADKFDAIEMGFVLEHVTDPGAIVRRYAEFLNPCGAIFIAVPNARSLHRLIGRGAGLLDDIHRLSPEDLQLGHQRYFDFAALSQLILAAGLEIVRSEGILLKPFTTSQLRSLNLSPQVVEALLKVGVDFPDVCNAVFVEARRA